MLSHVSHEVTLLDILTNATSMPHVVTSFSTLADATCVAQELTVVTSMPHHVALFNTLIQARRMPHFLIN